MSDINKVTITWTGWPGGPGYSTMYFVAEATPPLAAIQAFWSSLRPYIPTGITLQVQNTGVGLSVATGKPDGSWAGAVQPALTASAPAQYAGPVGGCFEWKTGAFLNGHQLKGRTFIVPFSSSNYDGNGTITDSMVTIMNTAATNLLAVTPNLAVYSPTNSTYRVASSGRLLDKACVMRSRRSR